jgi:hypothetical protein
MERAQLPTWAALVPNVLATQSVEYCPWQLGAIVAISTPAKNAVLIRFMIISDVPPIRLPNGAGHM